MSLPPRRLLNVMYHRIVDGGTAEARAEVDDQLANAADLLAYEPWPGLLPPYQPPLRAGRRRGAGRGPGNLRPRNRGRATIPGTSTHGIRPPSWWKGDRAAWSSTRAAAGQIEPAALRAAEGREGGRRVRRPGTGGRRVGV